MISFVTYIYLFVRIFYRYYVVRDYRLCLIEEKMEKIRLEENVALSARVHSARRSIDS